MVCIWSGKRKKGDRCLSQNISQHSLAKRINSSQSRVAKMEAGDPSVSLDLIVRTLLAIGATREDVAGALVQRNEVIVSANSKD